MFIASPPTRSPDRRELPLVRAIRRVFTGPAEFLSDPDNRARTAQYLTDMTDAYGRQLSATVEPHVDPGQSYGEMAQALIGAVVSADEPVDLLILAFSLHDVWPSRQTAAYLSDVTPGAPMAFAVCDQGSAAAFSGLRIAREYASSAAVRRALLVVVEQAGLPYDCPILLPSRHQGVAMLYGGAPSDSPSEGASQGQPALVGQARPSMLARVEDVRQHPGVAPGDVAGVASADLTDLAAGHRDIDLVLSDALAAVWTAPAVERVRVVAPDQPFTGVWWALIDELTGGTDRSELVVAADYDPELRYLCLTGFATTPALS